MEVSSFQRRAAEKAIRHVRGVRGIWNHIAADHGTLAGDVQHRITAALHRDADIDARHIDVAVVGRVATLTGRVTSWSQRDAAERAAASAPGISAVDNQLQIDGSEAVDEQC